VKPIQMIDRTGKDEIRKQRESERTKRADHDIMRELVFGNIKAFTQNTTELLGLASSPKKGDRSDDDSGSSFLNPLSAGRNLFSAVFEKEDHANDHVKSN
jgi:hypothetical protein